MIVIKNIQKKYKKINALDNIDLILDNKIYGLLGPNGSGKTTLLRIISGLLKPNQGIIEFQGKTIKESNIGYLPQKFGVFKELSIYKQLEYYCILKNIEKDKRDANIKKVLESVNLEDTKRMCKELSGGMIRRLGIAQSFLGNPDIILLDEPSVGLDVEERLRFKRILASKDFQCPVIVSTHIVEDVESTCDQLIVLNQGKIVYIGTPDEIRGVAQNHVYELSEEEYKSLTIPHDLVKIHDKDQKIYRILCDKELSNDKSRESEIEDGYMYLIKGPFHEI